MLRRGESRSRSMMTFVVRLPVTRSGASPESSSTGDTAYRPPESGAARRQNSGSRLDLGWPLVKGRRGQFSIAAAELVSRQIADWHLDASL